MRLSYIAVASARAMEYVLDGALVGSDRPALVNTWVERRDEYNKSTAACMSMDGIGQHRNKVRLTVHIPGVLTSRSV